MRFGRKLLSDVIMDLCYIMYPYYIRSFYTHDNDYDGNIGTVFDKYLIMIQYNSKRNGVVCLCKVWKLNGKMFVYPGLVYLVDLHSVIIYGLGAIFGIIITTVHRYKVF